MSAPVDRDALCEAIVRASMRGQAELVKQLEVQLLEANILVRPTATPPDPSRKAMRLRSSEERWAYAPCDEPARKQRGIDGATWAASLPEHEAQAAVFNRQRR